MNKRLLVTLALVAVVVIAVVACSKIKGGGEETTPSGPTTTTTPEPGTVTKTTVGKTTTYTGNLRGTNDSNRFEIFTHDKDIDVKFTYPAGATFGVKVIGMAGDELGEFKLPEGDVINLTGGGKFTLVVFSLNGSGKWTATYTED